MKKSVLLVAALAIAIATVPMFAAFEAHIINVTAHIENALTTHGGPLHFGTVFPQEYLDLPFTVSLSNSFMGQDRVNYVSYVIKQKPKCECDLWDQKPGPDDCLEGQYAPVGYATHECPAGYTEMESLCQYLSKLPQDQDGDEGVESYFVPDPTGGPNDTCVPRTGDEMAFGSLDLYGDYSDEWEVDLKVPPIDGYVGQDWPAGCPTLDQDPAGEDYGCDLWIEVTGIETVR